MNPCKSHFSCCVNKWKNNKQGITTQTCVGSMVLSFLPSFACIDGFKVLGVFFHAFFLVDS